MLFGFLVGVTVTLVATRLGKPLTVWYLKKEDEIKKELQK